MDIQSLSKNMSHTDVITQVGTAVLSMNLDVIDEMGDAMIKMMEQSVTPHLGTNVDISV